MSLNKIHQGDFVTASQIKDENSIRQGVVTQIFVGGRVLFIEGLDGDEYVCNGTSATVVPEANIANIAQEVKEIRSRCGFAC